MPSIFLIWRVPEVHGTLTLQCFTSKLFRRLSMKKALILTVLCVAPLLSASANPGDAAMQADAGMKQAEAVAEGAQKEIKGALDRVEAAKKTAESSKTAANVKAEQAQKDAKAAVNANAAAAAAHAGHSH
jgi:hypothetical protein